MGVAKVVRATRPVRCRTLDRPGQDTASHPLVDAAFLDNAHSHASGRVIAHPDRRRRLSNEKALPDRRPLVSASTAGRYCRDDYDGDESS